MTGVQTCALPIYWLTTQTSELAYAAFAPRGTPAPVLSVLRRAFERAGANPDFIEKSIAANGVPYGPVDVERGRSIISSLAATSSFSAVEFFQV